MKLSNFTQGRDNNFNIIRIVAALAVLITHSFALAIGSGDAEPLRASLGMTMGSIAVDVFFITSGFLVTASLLSRQCAIDFFWARALRILPALLVMLFLTVFGLGTFFTTLPLNTYFENSTIYLYLAKCATLITGVAYNLPGVFNGNPYKNAVNGSLWTMPYEVKMYAILAISWIILQVTKENRLSILKSMIVIGMALAGISVIVRHFYLSTTDGQFTRLFFMFFSGGAFYVLKEFITLSRLLFWFSVSALLLSAMINKQIFFLIYILTIAYVLFYIAYIPSGHIRKYNQVGDYSYGVYIYAFPVQQSVAALVPEISVLSMIIIAAAATLLLATISWHLIERRALSLKGLFINHTKKIITGTLANLPARQTKT